MNLLRGFLVLSALAMMMLIGQTWAADEKKAEGEKSESFTTPVEKYVSATSIDFAKALDLSAPSVRTIGSRIEEARQAPDPIGLASTARELAAVEAATGKQASLKSSDVMKEAIALAKLRGRSAELKAVAALVSDQAAAEDLQVAAKKAEKAEAEKAARAKNGELSRGICGVLHVNNQTHQHMEIYYNGMNIGCVDGYSTGQFYLNDHNWMFNLEARGDCGGYARRHVHGQMSHFDWTIVEGGHIH